MTTIRAKYRNGVLTPLEPLEIEEGAEVIVSLENAAPEAPEDAGTEETAAAPANGAHAGQSILQMFRELRESVPPDAWDNIPTDFVKNKKHYLYGHPKEEEE